MSNEINTNSGFRNNVVQVTSTNIKVAEKNAEAYAQRAEISVSECANYLALIQNIMAACNTIKTNIEGMFSDMDVHIDDVSNPHHVTAGQVGSYTKDETDSLLDEKQPVGNYLTEHQSLEGYYTKIESDSKYLTSHQDISGKVDSSELAEVATSGDYDDLTNKPTIPAVTTFSTGLTNNSNTVSVTDYDKLVKNKGMDITQNAFCVGNGSSVTINSPGSTVVGVDAHSYNSDGIAIGISAVARESRAIQIGTGTNNTQMSFAVGFGQTGPDVYAEYTLLDGFTGLIPDARLSTNIARSSEVSTKENVSNKVTSLSSSSTDTQYPSAKCVYDLVGNIETLLQGV